MREDTADGFFSEVLRMWTLVRKQEVAFRHLEAVL
jgi:hypothetical protein